MKYLTNQLRKYTVDPLEIDENKDYSADDLSDFSDKISELQHLRVTGTIQYNPNETINLQLIVKGNAKVFSTRSSNIISFPINISIDETYQTIEFDEEKSKESLDTYAMTDNLLDVDRIILENIVISLPTKIFDGNEFEFQENKWQVIEESAREDPDD